MWSQAELADQVLYTFMHRCEFAGLTTKTLATLPQSTSSLTDPIIPVPSWRVVRVVLEPLLDRFVS